MDEPLDLDTVVWICEKHPELDWPHDDCAGPGMPRTNRISGLVYQRDEARAEVERYKTEAEQLVWNLAGCDTYAMGYGLDENHHPGMARPALNSVKKLALREREQRRRLEAAERVVEERRLAAFRRRKAWEDKCPVGGPYQMPSGVREASIEERCYSEIKQALAGRGT